MRKKYSEPTLKKLFALSGNICAFPGCEQKIIDKDQNIVGEICHIEAAEPGGPRYNSNQNDDERRAFNNLVLFCRNHHKVTNNTNLYPVEKLKEIKVTHEAKFVGKRYQIDSDMIAKMLFSLNAGQITPEFGSGPQIITQSGDITVHSGPNKKEEFSGKIVTNDYRKQTVTDISERFNHILKLMNPWPQDWPQDFSVGKLAEIMGFEKVSDLSKYFNGQEEPTFAFMEKFCNCFGVNADWLKFGDATPYCSTEYPALYALDYYERICELQPKFIYFVKSNSKECKTVIALEIEEYKYIYFPKSYHISSYVGSTGREQIFSFYQLIRKLKDSGFYNQCFGRIVEPKLFRDIITGRVFLGSVCNRYGFNESWWDDFTDVYHKYPIAKGYEKRHGKEFIYAQRIVRGFLDEKKY